MNETKVKGQGYHWLILACSLVFSGIPALYQNVQGVFGIHVTETIGASMSEFNVFITVISLASAVMLLVLSVLFKKNVDVRKLCIVCSILVSGALIGLSYSTQIWQFYVLGAVAGGGGTIFALAAAILVAQWFKDKLGVATGIRTSGVSVINIIIMPLATAIIVATSWQFAYRVLGIAFAVLSLPLLLFVVKMTPQEKGMLPYTDKNAKGESTVTANAETAAAPTAIVGVPYNKAVKSLAFWGLSIGYFFAGIVLMASMMNTVPYLTSVGYDVETAALAVSAISLAALVGKLVIGYFADKLSGAVIAILCGILGVSGLIAYTLVEISSIYVWIFSITVGIYGVQPTLMIGILIPKYFGLTSMARISSVMSLLMMIGIALGPALGSMVRDITGSYATSWIVFAVMAAINALACVAADRSAKKLVFEEA